MTVALRLVLDQLVAPTDADLASASRCLARGLVAAAPTGCEVTAITPAAPAQQLESLRAEVTGLAGVHRAALGRRELAAAWQLGASSGVGAGMIHSPTLFAPLVKHDRVHDHDQTVVTLWDLDAWEAPERLSRAAVTWRRAMLKRAVKHADAVVVPTHAMAVRLGAFARLGDRVRVIAGAPPIGYETPTDAAGRLRDLALPPAFVALDASAGLPAALTAAADALAADSDLHAVVVDATEGSEPAVADAAAAAGIPERRVHVRGTLDARDRAAVIGSARAFATASRRSAFPWRVLEALQLGTPVVAAASPVHAEVILDGGLVVGDPEQEVDAGGLAAALTRTVTDDEAVRRLRVLATDRARAFSWRAAADRVWQLHADL